MGLLRTIPFAPDYTITRAGEVRHESNRHKPVPHITHQGRFGLNHAAVMLDGERHYVWRILSRVWYDRNLILNRDGGLMRWSPDDTFILSELKYVKALKSSTPVIDEDEILYVWHLYQKERVPCWQMAERSALLFHVTEDYRALVKDILMASVK